MKKLLKAKAKFSKKKAKAQSKYAKKMAKAKYKSSKNDHDEDDMYLGHGMGKRFNKYMEGGE